MTKTYVPVHPGHLPHIACQGRAQPTSSTSFGPVSRVERSVRPSNSLFSAPARHVIVSDQSAPSAGKALSAVSTRPRTRNPTVGDPDHIPLAGRSGDGRRSQTPSHPTPPSRRQHSSPCPRPSGSAAGCRPMTTARCRRRSPTTYWQQPHHHRRRRRPRPRGSRPRGR